MATACQAMKVGVRMMPPGDRHARESAVAATMPLTLFCLPPRSSARRSVGRRQCRQY
jgi:hypothetical protein